MGVVITDLPDEIDPIILIENKLKKCPLCGQRCDEEPLNWDENKRGAFMHRWPNFYPDEKKADEKGKIHKILLSKNKYLWKRYDNLKCPSCGCSWDTG